MWKRHRVDLHGGLVAGARVAAIIGGGGGGGGGGGKSWTTRTFLNASPPPSPTGNYNSSRFTR